MHLLDFILVLVLLPCIDAFQNKPIANNSCGYLEVKTPSLLFYGRNVTITFKAYKHKNATALLINNSDPTISHKPHHHDNQTDVFTFILHQNRTARRHQNYYVNNTCYSDTISFEMREPPALGPRKNIEGCDGCLIASVGDKADSLKNKEPLISCSMSNATSWTVFITINNKSGAARHYLHGKYVINYTVHEDDNMTMVKCFMTFSNLTLIDTAILYVKDDSATKIQHPSVTNVNDQTQSSKTFIEKSTQSTSTKSATDKQAVSTPRKPLSTTPRIVQTSAPSDALKTTENFISTTHTGHGKHDKRTDATSTTKSQPISNDANTDKKDTSVSNTSASNDGFQNVIIVVSCAVSAVIIVIAILIAVVCVKRKRRSGANAPVQDAPREDQVAKEEGYARIEGAECQYAVVNKPKKLSTLRTKQYPRVENIPMEIQSKLEKPRGAGELIYADLDKEALTAKPSNSKPAGIPERPRTPTEYVGIDFARTVALQDANMQDE